MRINNEADPQNIYDDVRFFNDYRTLRQSDTGLNGAVEVPALRSLLPNLKGRDVLDLGCGFGDFARYARSCGAESVTAVDISKRMLEEATRLTDDPGITYLESSIESFVPRRQSVDVVVSSLALHYVESYAKVVHQIFESLKPAGQFVFSIEHPLVTANPVGWVRDGDDLLHWPLDNYSEEGQRDTKWFVDGVIKYHRTVATYVNTLIARGFRIDRLEEPGPVVPALAVRPELEQERRRPPFLLLAASRPT
ncbi:class I SAM-dependent methyltransferase [Phyllobacterium salinisoli]|uniref:Class I SAM-dependent methyltransferase n=1 Tax=Phyllobacterium salinisoli TaxID=1899321 RepID=A0A368K2W7_9HYPH|nr:class I SAM-dependent methyltransferase [Phyllobacterium salinisoli]RCS22823.1 class I SAM-dependent methyltransferase [Phyllobacterium salinisoli]